MNPFQTKPLDSFNIIKNKICETENLMHLDKSNIKNKGTLSLSGDYVITTSFTRLSIYSFFHSTTMMSYKIKYLSDVLDNSFFNDESKVHIVRIFCKIKKVYNIFSRIANKVRWNKMKTYDYNYDLCMNDLSDYNSSTLIQIAENNVKYIFRISDMIKIFNNALTNNDEMFADPLPVKNPYTNREISLHNLYNIYYAIKYANINMPILMHLYFLSNFDLDDFLLDNEEKIRDMMIMSYIVNISKCKLTKLIREMFSQYRFSFRLKVDADFPKETLNEIFRPFVKLYIQIKYTLSRTKRANFIYTLKNKLSLFCKHAPLFGRKIIKLVNKKKSHHYFNIDCKTFNELHNIDEMNHVNSGTIDYNTESDSETDSDDETIMNNPPPSIDVTNQTINETNQTINETNRTINETNQTINETNQTIDQINQTIINNPPPPLDELANDQTNQVNQIIDNRTIQPFVFLHNMNAEWYTASELNNNINAYNAPLNGINNQYFIDPISLYNYHDNSNEEENMDNETDDDEEVERPFPYNYDSH